MAHIKYIYVHSHDMPTDEITVNIALKPAGEHSLKVKIPAKFKAVLLDMAQKAADLHEAQMRAEILADEQQPKQPAHGEGDE